MSFAGWLGLLGSQKPTQTQPCAEELFDTDSSSVNTDDLTELPANLTFEETEGENDYEELEVGIEEGDESFGDESEEHEAVDADETVPETETPKATRQSAGTNQDTLYYIRRHKPTIEASEALTKEETKAAQKRYHNARRSNKGRMNWDCIGCDGSCTHILNTNMLLNVCPITFSAWADRHGLLWKRQLCFHPEAEAYVLRTLPEEMETAAQRDARLKDDLPIGKRLVCPFPNCRLLDDPNGPVHNNSKKVTINQKFGFVFLWARGNSHMAIATELSLHTNSLTPWRKDLERMVAGYHYHRAFTWKGLVRSCQADEWCVGKRKNSRGKEVSRVGQLWFQSLAVLDDNGRVIEFFVRYVKDRTKTTLCPWILDFLADGAKVVTDCFSSYKDLPNLALARGLRINYDRVNHSTQFKNANGNHTNSVEGMHMHCRTFLHRFVRLGSTQEEVINRVVASADLASPAPNGYESKFQKVMRAIASISRHGFDFGKEMDAEIAGRPRPSYVQLEFDPKRPTVAMPLRYSEGGRAYIKTSRPTQDTEKETEEEGESPPKKQRPEAESLAKLQKEVKKVEKKRAKARELAESAKNRELNARKMAAIKAKEAADLDRAAQQAKVRLSNFKRQKAEESTDDEEEELC